MKGLENWTHRYYLERLSMMVDAAQSAHGRDNRVEMRMYVDLAELVLKDGKHLDLDDPALMLLIRFLDNAVHRTLENLFEVFDGIRIHFNKDTAKERLDEINIDTIHEFFELKNSGGWGEIDRIVNHLIGQTLTNLVDSIESKLLYDPADPGLGGGDCFTIGYDGNDGFAGINGGAYVPPTKAAFGSAPEYVIGFIPKVAAIACEEFRGAGGPLLTYIACKKNRDLVCTIPFGPQDLKNFSRPDIVWKDIKWKQGSLNLVKAIVKVAPREARHLVKGSFLEDDLGM